MLSALITVPPNRRASRSAKADFPLHVGPATISACRITPALPCAPPMSFVLTLIAEPGRLDPALIARVAEAVGAGPAITLSPDEAVDLPCPTTPDPACLCTALADALVDAVVTPATNRRKRLLVADMDSTMVVGETLDELAQFAGVGERVAAITARAMAGEIDFKAALQERVALLEGLDLAALDKTWAATRLMPGARELVATMRANGARTALVSGGFHLLHRPRRRRARLRGAPRQCPCSTTAPDCSAVWRSRSWTAPPSWKA